MEEKNKQYKIQIKEHHVDSLGHVNNATYLELFEEARWEIITQSGYGFVKVQTEQKGPVILEIQMKFLNEVTLREHVTVSMELIDYVKKVGHLKQQMIKEDGSVACEAIFTFGLFDMKLRKLIEPTKDWMQAVSLT